MTHQTLSLEKYWKLFPATFNHVYIYSFQRDVYKTWTGVHGPPHGPGPWTRSMDPVHGPPHGPPLIFNWKSPLIILKFTGGQGMNKNTDSYLLLTSLRVCLVMAGCFGVAPHKWEDHKLVLRYRRSSTFLPPIFSFQFVNLMEERECIQFSY